MEIHEDNMKCSDFKQSQNKIPRVAYLRCFLVSTGLFIYFNKCQKKWQKRQTQWIQKKLKPHAHTTSEHVKHVAIVVTP